MQMHEIQQLARDVGQALLHDKIAIVHQGLCRGEKCKCVHEVHEVHEATVERIIFDVLDRALYTP